MISEVVVRVAVGPTLLALLSAAYLLLANRDPAAASPILQLRRMTHPQQETRVP